MGNSSFFQEDELLVSVGNLDAIWSRSTYVMTPFHLISPGLAPAVGTPKQLRLLQRTGCQRPPMNSSDPLWSSRPKGSNQHPHFGMSICQQYNEVEKLSLYVCHDSEKMVVILQHTFWGFVKGPPRYKPTHSGCSLLCGCWVAHLQDQTEEQHTFCRRGTRKNLQHWRDHLH